MDLHRHGVLEKFGVEMIGAKPDVIAKAENRDQFKRGDGEDRAGGAAAARRSIISRKAARVPQDVGLPCVLRPSFTLGGQRLGDRLQPRGVRRPGAPRTGVFADHEVLIEESIIGWKEYEMEVMRDADDNVVIICSIENFDPMGVHTGDSITVAPAQTLTDKEYQRMRDASLAVIREIGVETGGSNIQFAIDPKTGG